MKSLLEGMSLRELSLLIHATERLGALRRCRPPNVVRPELEAMATAHRYSIDELVGQPTAVVARKSGGAKRKVAKVAPKYRHPDNNLNMRSGRGSAPTWLSEKEKRGHHRADLLIPGLARPIAKLEGVGKRSDFKRP